MTKRFILSISALLCILGAMPLLAQHQWFKKNIVPDVTDESLNRAAIIPGTRDVAFAGKGSTVLKLEDCGHAIWDIYGNINNTNRRLDGIIFFNENEGIATGDGTSIFKTADGGETWTSQEVSDGELLEVIGFATKDIGVVGGFNGKMYRTTDRGATWSEVVSGVPGRITGIDFSDENVGYLCTILPGEVYKTIDGGQTWHLTYSDAASIVRFQDLDASDPDSVFVAGSEGSYLATLDGGHNWQLRQVEANPTLIFLDVEHLGGGTVMLAGGSRIMAAGLRFGRLFYSTDLGNSWTSWSTDIGQDIEFHDLLFVNETTGYMSGRHGAVYRTNDAGANWEVLNEVIWDDVNNVDFVSNQVGYANTRYIRRTDDYFEVINRLFRTDDGGNNWHRVETEDLFGGVDFINETDGISIGNKVRITRDGGLTWQETTPVINAGFDNVIYTDETTIFLSSVGDFFTAADVNILFRSDDGGLTWTEVLRSDPTISPNRGGFEGMDFFDEQQGIIIDDLGNIFRTFDGGDTWDENLVFGVKSMFDVAYASANSAIIVGRTDLASGQPLLARTDDSGENWTTLLSPTSVAPIEIVEFYDDSTGIISTLTEIWETNDGGHSWDYISNPSGEIIRDIVYKPDGSLVFVGDRETIYANYRNVAQTPLGIDDEPAIASSDFTLHRNYPNPFNPSTRIDYELARAADVDLAVYDVLGRKVRQLVFERKSAGNYQITWDGKNIHGNDVQSGVYFYRLSDGVQHITEKMMLVR